MLLHSSIFTTTTITPDIQYYHYYQENKLAIFIYYILSFYDLLYLIRYDVEGMVYNRDAYHELINKSVGDYAYIYMYFYLLSASSYILIHH